MKTQNHTKPSIVAAAVIASVLAFAGSAQASLITSSANLPPAGVYLGLDIHQKYGGPALEFLLTLPAHKPLADHPVERKPGGGGEAGTPADEIETFDSELTAKLEVKVGGVSIGPPQPIFASGSVKTIVFGKIGNTTGEFDTEMLQLNLSGVGPGGPFMIRESPTLASTGKTKIADHSPGLYKIDSFFDVFTELSIDGGATWMPSTTGPGHVELQAVPEPSTILAGGLLLLPLGLHAMRQLRRRQEAA